MRRLIVRFEAVDLLVVSQGVAICGGGDSTQTAWFTEAGLKPSDEVRVTAAGRGRVVLERDVNVVERHAGALPGVYERGELDRLRDEWR